MAMQAKSDIKKIGRPRTFGKPLLVRLNPHQFKVVERVAKAMDVSKPEALRRMCFAEAAE